MTMKTNISAAVFGVVLALTGVTTVLGQTRQGADAPAKPAKDSAPFALRLDCGSYRAWTDDQGRSWAREARGKQADGPYVLGGNAAQRDMTTTASEAPFRVFYSERFGSHLTYVLPAPEGDYTLRLHFSETFDQIDSAGKRVFDVLVNGKPLFEGVDPFKDGGGLHQASMRTATVRPKDGAVTVELIAREQMAAINALELIATEASETGWIDLFDGKTLDGWQANEHHEIWKIEDGCITVDGPFSHLFYLGPDGNAMYGDFELKVKVKMNPGCNSGIFIRTPPKAECDKYLNGSIEAQLQNDGKSPCYTGGLWARAPRAEASPVKPDEWFEVHLIAKGDTVTVKINGETTTEYTYDSKRRPAGHIALQGHGKNHRPMFRSVRIKPLSEE